MQILLGLFAIDDFTGFEITKLVELPEPWGIIVVWGLVLPLVFVLVNAVTGLILKDGLILQVRFFPMAPVGHSAVVMTLNSVMGWRGPSRGAGAGRRSSWPICCVQSQRQLASPAALCIDMACSFGFVKLHAACRGPSVGG